MYTVDNIRNGGIVLYMREGGREGGKDRWREIERDVERDRENR